MIKNQIALEKSMVEIELGQLFKIFLCAFTTPLMDDMMKEVFHLVDIINEYLKEILYTNLLLILKFEMFKGLSHPFSSSLFMLNKSCNNVFD